MGENMNDEIKMLSTYQSKSIAIEALSMAMDKHGDFNDPRKFNAFDASTVLAGMFGMDKIDALDLMIEYRAKVKSKSITGTY